jgi:crotonobetainyl-CoA:carnitine CoA-transferase CaiB-like acyl-CoA transferase
MTLPQAPVAFSAASYQASSASPAYGQHSAELLAECGFTADEVDALLKDGAVGAPRSFAKGRP